MFECTIQSNASSRIPGHRSDATLQKYEFSPGKLHRSPRVSRKLHSTATTREISLLITIHLARPRSPLRPNFSSSTPFVGRSRVKEKGPEQASAWSIRLSKHFRNRVCSGDFCLVFFLRRGGPEPRAFPSRWFRPFSPGTRSITRVDKRLSRRIYQPSRSIGCNRCSLSWGSTHCVMVSLSRVRV